MKTIFSSFDNLWGILMRVVNHKDAGEILCILDALDKCEEQGRFRILEALCETYSRDGRWNLVSRFKVIFTSRPYLDIQQHFQPLENGLQTIYLSGDNESEVSKIAVEIDLNIQYRTQELAAKLNLQPSERQVLDDGLTRVPNRTYLWVHLVFGVLESLIVCSQSTLEKTVNELPSTVDKAYESILDRSPDSRKRRTILHIIVAAKRPLSLGEMAMVLAIKEKRGNCHEIEVEPEDRFRNTTRALCGLFVTVTDSKIYLIHQTARDFLVQEKRLDSSTAAQRNESSWKRLLRPADSHGILVEVCVWYIHFAGDICTKDRAAQQHKVHPFFKYCAVYWTNHLGAADIEKKEAMVPSLMKVCNTHREGCTAWLDIYSKYLRMPPYLRRGYTIFLLATFFLAWLRL